MTLDLSGPRAKLDRAEYHLNALIDEVRSVMELHGEPIAVRYNPIDKSHSVIFNESQPVPSADWGIALGDFVHNMRSALDHLVAVLVADANHQIHNTHQFPILSQPSDWQSKVVNPPRNRRGQLDFVNSSYIAIIEEVQPYQPSTGLQSLATIRDFSNTDKHRLIHAVRRRLLASPSVSATQTIPLTIIGVTYSDPDSPLENGTEVARVRSHFDITFNPITGAPDLPHGSEMNMQVDMRMTVVFGPPGQEDTRIGDFRNCLADFRTLLARF